MPGSKSYTNRALLMAALTAGDVRLERPLLSDDTVAMMRCLRALGLAVEEAGETVTVSGDARQIRDEAYTLDAGLSGTTIRFLLALACVIPGTQVITGREGLLKRPIGDLVDSLRRLGAEIEYLGTEGCPPLRVISSQLHAKKIDVNGSVSSQYLSALLMITPAIGGGVTIEVTGEQISKPYVAMTIDGMRAFGVLVEEPQPGVYRVAAGQAYRCERYRVEGDASSAGYFFAIATLTQSTITVQNLNPGSVQADMRLLDILARMGSEIRRGDNEVTVIGHGVKPLDADMADYPDQAMTVAVLAAFAPGVSKLRGVQSLRVKETERVVALEQELAKMGICTESAPDTLIIHGGKPHSVAIDTYGDHRMAMAFAVAGTKLAGMRIRNPGVVSKTFPTFWDVIAEIYPAKKHESVANIILIGMRGSGKTTVGKLLAERLSRNFIDMDLQLVEQTGKTIPELVAEHGWPYFRNKETELVHGMGKLTHTVIATGGGVLLRPENVRALKSSGTLVLLEASLGTLVDRLAGASDRPALTEAATLKDELAQLLDERGRLYRKTADIRLTTDNRTPEEAVDAILQHIEDNHKG